ncbi:MAG TPA: hypothetical protein VMM77_09805 [Gemmatimonadaceae bacterium]|nr:hypothetical protein [Gemmatimonadaceae bacterium]
MPLPLVSARFAYLPGEFRYEVITESVIRQPDESSEAEAVVRTRAILTLRLSPIGSDSLRVEMIVDSVEAERDSLIPAPDSLSLMLPRFAAIMNPRGAVLAGPPAPTIECASGAPLLEVARDLLVAVPEELRVGEGWADTSSMTICRGGVPVTTGVVRAYEVLGTRRDDDGTPLVRLARATTFSLAGTETTALGQVIALTGTGESQTVLELDLAGGVVRSAIREGTADLAVSYGRTTTPFSQRMTQTVRWLRSLGYDGR